MTNDDRRMLTFQRTYFPEFVTDFTVHYDNESCLFSNWRQLWSQCSETQPPERLYICKASYHTTLDNNSVVDGLAALPPQKFKFAADVLCVAVGCSVRLIRNLNVSAGLVNSATGRVVAVIYNNTDCQDLLSGKHPPPYCVVVEFSGFQVYKYT
jgi:hypothetical protein